MNTEKGSDNFDQDIDALYVQRKHKIKSPDITFKEKSLKKTYSFRGILSLILLGGVASFGILAVINHLAKPSNKDQQKNKSYLTQVDIIHIEKANNAEQLIHVKTHNPPENLNKKLTEQPIRNFDIDTVYQIKPMPAKAISLSSSNVQAIRILTNKLEYNVSQPTFRVMPKLSRNITSQETGRIRLTYTLAIDGKVQNINIIESSLNRQLERSAIESLSQWRYMPKSSNGELLHIEFQFN